MNIDLFTQTDPRWKNAPMATSEDKLNDYGCLVACYSNITVSSLKTPITPALLNYLLILNKGYLVLAQPNCKKAETSFILHKVVGNILNCKINTEYKSNPENKQNKYYIGKIVINKNLSHFVNILNFNPVNNEVLIFDVYDGKRKNINKNSVVKIIEVVF
ncbi:MAG TPA: hypothetical protein PLG34_12265 [Spirochaetota bacterium]|nr:hypothetical protein [Spirochaetota bacterium]HQB60047.1 hypothetical protein [Spirochaetota bacterium]